MMAEEPTNARMLRIPKYVEYLLKNYPPVVNLSDSRHAITSSIRLV